VPQHNCGFTHSAVMWTPTLVLMAATAVMAGAMLGGGMYEALVVDPSRPRRPGIIQPVRPLI
jgi:hypothetical protein